MIDNGYFIAGIKAWIAGRASRSYWYMNGKYHKVAARIRKIRCILGAHGVPLIRTIRYRQLKLDIGTCRHCDAYIEIHGRITTEVPYDREIPFEGFKIEPYPSSDPTSAFYKPIDPQKAPVGAGIQGHASQRLRRGQSVNFRRMIP